MKKTLLVIGVEFKGVLSDTDIHIVLSNIKNNFYYIGENSMASPIGKVICMGRQVANPRKKRISKKSS